MLLLRSKNKIPSTPPPSLLSTISNNCRKHYSLASVSPPAQDPIVKVKTGAIVPGVSTVYVLIKKNEQEIKDKRKVEQQAGAPTISVVQKKKSEETLSKIKLKQDGKPEKSSLVVYQNIHHRSKLTFSRRTSKKRIELKLIHLSMKVTSIKTDFFTRLQLQSQPLKPYLVTFITLLSRFERKQNQRTLQYVWRALK